ncbi:uncharacterized protein LOC144022089 [Festucalex cinctus]
MLQNMGVLTLWPTHVRNLFRKDGKDSSLGRSHASGLTSPKAKRPSLDSKKERKVPKDPNTPWTPLSLNLHPPPPRKEPPDPNAPLPPLPLHLHPPPAPKRPSLDGKKERKDTSDSKIASQKTSDYLKRDRKDSLDSKMAKKKSMDAKKERLEMHECESACLAVGKYTTKLIGNWQIKYRRGT